jgi:CHAT domain-containing protein/tetratricopeptide (TPR) repeat protein
MSRYLVALGVAAVLMAALPGAQVSSAGLLVIGTAVERGLQGNGQERFFVDLQPGDFLLATIDQRGIDLTARLIAPDGAIVTVRDSPNGDYGPECVAFIATTGGRYRLEIISLAGSASVPAGRFQLVVEAIRRPNKADVEHVQAGQLLHDAFQLRQLNTADARGRALDGLAAAVDIFERLGLQYEAAMSLHSIGVGHLRGGETRRAIPFLERAALLFKSLGSHMYPSTVNALGGVADLLGDTSSAIDRYNEALSYYRSIGTASGEGLARNNIGKLYSDTANWQQALHEYRQALALFRAAGDRNREALALYNIGMAYGWLGDTDQALAYLSEALPIREASVDKAAQADVLTSMGRIELDRRQPGKALTHLEQALPLRRTVGDQRSEGTTLAYMGEALLESKRSTEAIALLERAIDLRRAGGDRRGGALTLLTMSRAYAENGQAELARTTALESLSILRDLGDRNGAANALKRIAEAEDRLGRLPQALAYSEDVIQEIEEVRGRVSSPELRTGYIAKQKNAYGAVVDLLMRGRDDESHERRTERALEMSERARARSLLEMLTESNIDIRRGADLELVGRERQLSDLIKVKSDRLMPLIARDRTTDAAEVLLRDVASLEAEYQEVRARVRTSSPAYAALTQPQPVRLGTMQNEILDSDTRLIEYWLGDRSSYAWVVDQQSIHGVTLPPRIEIENAARVVYDFVTARGTLPPGEKPTDRQRRIAAADAALPNALRQLSDLVLKPLLPLTGASRLLIVADGALQYIPFGMLPIVDDATPARPVIADFEIVTMPSASVLAVQRAQVAARPRATGGVAVIADPVFDRADVRLSGARKPADENEGAAQSDDVSRILEHIAAKAAPVPNQPARRSVIPRLPFTRTEADAILAAAKSQKNFRAVDFAATKDAVVGGALKNFRIVHFATHGFLDTERPSLSSIVLSLVDRNGKARDGFLRAQELYNLELNADLVVLSACQTGLGKSIEGEGLIGLTRGLMYAGAARVVVSLWNVSDKATASLMSHFYRDMLAAGKPPSAALRAAQLALAKQKGWENPYYWAPFVMQGDWR